MLPRSQPAFHLATGAYAVLAMNYLAPRPWHQAGRLGLVKSLLGSLCIALGLVSHTTSRGILLVRCHKDGLRMLVRHCHQKRQDQRSTVRQLSNSAPRSWCLISKLYESMKVNGEVECSSFTASLRQSSFPRGIFDSTLHKIVGYPWRLDD
jgi:hypothetical protein